jgi:hypothetical protein
MNPEQPQMSMSQPPEGRVPSGSFQGDKVFVGLDVLLYIASAAWSFMLTQSRVDEALERMKGTPNDGKVSREMIEAWTLGFTGGCMCLFLVIYIFLWLNMVKGKKWAFIAMIFFTLIGLAFAGMGMSGVGMGLAVTGIVTGLVKLVYLIMRSVGKIGPRLN